MTHYELRSGCGLTLDAFPLLSQAIQAAKAWGASDWYIVAVRVDQWRCR